MIDNLGIYWFRQDLRLNDNLALNSIVEKSDYIIPIYILDENFDLGGASKWWLHNSLRSLNASLRERNSQLFFFKGDPKEILKKLIYRYKIKSIYWNRLYDKISIKRDTEIKSIFNQIKHYPYLVLVMKNLVKHHQRLVLQK